MKLLFDQNLAPRLARSLSDQNPGSAHVRDVGLREAEDLTVWRYARQHGFTLVSKDSDFHQLSFLHGHPPKVVWLRIGNGPTSAVEAVLRKHSEELRRFANDPEEAFLALA